MRLLFLKEILILCKNWQELIPEFQQEKEKYIYFQGWFYVKNVEIH